MQITIDKLLKQIENFHPICSVIKNDPFSITSICLFTKDTNFTNIEFLYIGYASEFLPEKSFESPILIICIEDVPILENFQFPNEIYLIRLLADTNILTVYNTINTLFHEDILIKSLQLLY
jgi:hypothetical protein